MVKKVFALIGISYFLSLHSSQDLSRDLFAYTYHNKQLQEEWFKDRVAKPAFYASCLGVSSFITTLFILQSFFGIKDTLAGLLGVSSMVGACSFFTSWISFMVLKGLLRLLKENPEEKSLKQSLCVLSLKLKQAIADGDINLGELERCLVFTDCPLKRELMQYARAFYVF